MTHQPSPNGPNGRDRRGRFAKGNPGGPGNPHARHVAQLRSAMLEAVSEKDIAIIIERLVDAAKGGDLAAAREILNRTVGKPIQTAIWMQGDVANENADFGTAIRAALDELDAREEADFLKDGPDKIPGKIVGGKGDQTGKGWR